MKPVREGNASNPKRLKLGHTHAARPANGNPAALTRSRDGIFCGSGIQYSGDSYDLIMKQAPTIP